MSLDTNPNLGNGGAGFQGSGPGSAAFMIRELQGVQKAAVAGAAATTPIAVAGIDVGDTVGSVYDATGHQMIDPADITITAGNITFGTVDTTGLNLLVEWYPKP